MFSVAKAGAIVAVVGAGLTGTYFLVVGVNSMPDYELISDASSYSNKLGSYYKHFLVDKDKNNEWWDWSYNNWKREKGISNEFGEGKVTVGFSREDNVATSLNKRCDEVYKKADSEVNFDSGSEDSHKLGKDLLKYCSPLGQKPVSVKDNEGYGNTNIGGGNDKTSLISTKEDKNYYFWDAMKKYLEQNGNKPTDAFFGRIDDSNHIKKLCEEAYKTTSSNTPSITNPKLDDVKKYCVFSKLSS